MTDITYIDCDNFCRGVKTQLFSRLGLTSLQGNFIETRTAFYITMTSKQCSKCKTEKSLNEFCKDKRRKNGLSPQCKSCMYAYKKLYYSKNQEQLNDYSKGYNKANSSKIREQKRVRNKNRRASDPAYKLLERLRSRSKMAMAGGKASASTMELLGCSPDHARQHLEAQFTDGMSWDNYGFYGWHIDHIMPCDSFDLTDPEQQRRCFNYTNLQPLWAADNLKKSNKVQ